MEALRRTGKIMPTFEEARALILGSVAPLPAESVGILESLGRVAAEDIAAPWDIPLCDNSAMDGYAVRAADCRDATSLRVTGFIPAGATAVPTLEPGCAIRIMTGARLPTGCDAVVPLEDTEPESNGRVTLKTGCALHQHIRFAGEDVRRGEVVIPAGTLLRPPEISMLASCGRLQVAVHRRPRVAILSTGDELVAMGEAVAPGQVVDSNGPALAAAVQECGALPELLGIARDTRESHLEKMTAGLSADVLLTSAGVSVGDRDLVREVLDQLGLKQLFHHIDIRPGSPTSFGLKEKTPVFSLPGNPVSSLITFEEFVRPALLKMMGHRRVVRASLRAVLQEKIQKKPGNAAFRRVRLEQVEGRYLAYSAGDQSTGILRTMIRANAIALLPKDCTSFSPGEVIEVHPISAETGMVEA